MVVWLGSMNQGRPSCGFKRSSDRGRRNAHLVMKRAKQVWASPLLIAIPHAIARRSDIEPWDW